MLSRRDAPDATRQRRAESHSTPFRETPCEAPSTSASSETCSLFRNKDVLIWTTIGCYTSIPLCMDRHGVIIVSQGSWADLQIFLSMKVINSETGWDTAVAQEHKSNMRIWRRPLCSFVYQSHRAAWKKEYELHSTVLLFFQRGLPVFVKYHKKPNNNELLIIITPSFNNFPTLSVYMFRQKM